MSVRDHLDFIHWGVTTHTPCNVSVTLTAIPDCVRGKKALDSSMHLSLSMFLSFRWDVTSHLTLLVTCPGHHDGLTFWTMSKYKTWCPQVPPAREFCHNNRERNSDVYTVFHNGYFNCFYSCQQCVNSIFSTSSSMLIFHLLIKNLLSSVR